MKTKCLLAAITALLIISAFPLAAQDWPQFLGPDRNSISPQKGLLRSWPESGPEALWTVNMGIGYGGAIAKDGKVYVLDREDGVCDIMRCLDLNTGKELWRFSYDAPGTLPFPGSRSVPIVDDRHVYSCGPNGDLYCIDLNTYKPVWNKNVWTDFGGEKLPTWGIAQCPIIYGDLLVIASQASQAGVVAYNKFTGDVVWQTHNLGYIGYSNPKVVNISSEDQIVYITSSFIPRDESKATIMGNVVGINPNTGEILWQYSDWVSPGQVPCAVDAGDNRLLISGETRSTMLKINRNANGTFEASEVFTTEEFGDETKTPLLHNGYFYAMFRTVSKREGLVCMDMNGEIMWKTKRNPNFDFGSMILADGLLLATDGSKTLYLIEPDPAGFKSISKAEVLKEGGGSTEGMERMVGSSTQNYAPIALADGKLLVRDQGKMVCVKVIE